MKTFVHGNVVLQGQFDDMLNDKKSDKYIEMKWNLENNLKSVFCDAVPNCFSITSFREGSIIANFLVEVATGSQSGCESVDRVASQMGNLPANINGVPLSAGNIVRGKSVFQILYVALCC